MRDDIQSDDFEALLTSLEDERVPLKAALIYRLSEPSADDLAALKIRWQFVPAERRRQLLTRLAETTETSFDVDFTTVALFALGDDDAEVRAQAIAALWISEDAGTMRRLIGIMETDEDAEVRAAAAEALGRFVLAGELGDLPESVAREAEHALLASLGSDDNLNVQRRALESLSYSGRDEIPPLIEVSYRHPDFLARASAVFAMGRSADSRWERYVTEALADAQPELRFEAARAAGEIGLTSAVPRLIRLAQESDREIKEAAIWSLGEIGGSEAQRALFDLADQEDDEALTEAIEDALNTASLSLGEFTAYRLAPADDDDLDPDQLDEFEDLDD